MTTIDPRIFDDDETAPFTEPDWNEWEDEDDEEDKELYE